MYVSIPYEETLEAHFGHFEDKISEIVVSPIVQGIRNDLILSPEDNQE